MTSIIHPVILCGGSGARLWPLSTPEVPKQFLSLTSKNSMIEETVARFQTSHDDAVAFSSALIIASKKHERLLDEMLPDLKKVLEPTGRNSAPAVAAACLAHDLQDLILILPADHNIQDVAPFHSAIAVAAKAAESGSIVTFGIEPTHPATGYGYIKAARESDGGALSVDQYVEKPDIETAEAYFDAGTFYWNSGIFLFKAGVMLDALEKFAPDVLAGVRKAIGDASGDVIALDPEAFKTTPSISIDYAVLEKAENVKTVPVSMGWSDIGGYRALRELLTDDMADNYTSGRVHIQNSSGLFVRSEGPVISVNGVSNLIIVATPSEVMITPIDDDSVVKSLGAAIQNRRHMLGLSSDALKQTQLWIRRAFDTWAKVGWDPVNGGFVEQLSIDGTPDIQAPRRVRVQARQVFSFSKAIQLGWTDIEVAGRLVEQGLHYIDRCLRHSKGGFIHRIKANGTAIDTRRDLYDHAFLILAGAAAYTAIGSLRGLKIADDAIAYIDRELKDDKNGGWLESNKQELPRRSNPHTHLLEAMLEYHAATGADSALGRAAEIIRLFENKFFDPEKNILAEHFGQDWTRSGTAEDVLFEPGHHYEWATLLYQYEGAIAHDTLSWRRRLIRRADQIGLNPKTGFALNTLLSNGQELNPASRLWPQLERFRAYLFHPELSPHSNTAQILCDIFDHFITPAPAGCWIDELNQNGQPVSDNIPASMLYHFVTAFEPILGSD